MNQPSPLPETIVLHHITQHRKAHYKNGLTQSNDILTQTT